jgi:hypothetical protein
MECSLIFCWMFHKSAAAALLTAALLFGKGLFRPQSVATKLCGQNGQRANAVKEACRRSLR